MEKTLAYYLTYLYKNFSAYTRSELKSIGLSYGQLPFILYIGNHAGCTQASLTENLHMDWGYCQRSVTKLTETDFIVRCNKEGDSRNYHLSLTEKGRQAFQLSHDLFFRWDQFSLQGLNENEIHILFSLLEKVVNNKGIQDNRNTGKKE